MSISKISFFHFKNSFLARTVIKSSLDRCYSFIAQMFELYNILPKNCLNSRFHHHLQRRLMFHFLKSLTPSSPFFLDLHTLDHLPIKYLFFIFASYHAKINISYIYSKFNEGFIQEEHWHDVGRQVEKAGINKSQSPSRWGSSTLPSIVS
jgi:hypothetical protein